MRYTTLGETSIRVSVICQGCWSLAGGRIWGPQDEADSIAALQQGLDVGINFFDSAEAYGNGGSEELLGKVLADRRREIVLATKVSGERLPDPSAIKSACEGSLRRLRTECIDLYQVHWPHPHANMAEVVGTLVELREEGKIHALGVSNFGVSYLDDILSVGRIETNQLCYSLMWRAIEYAIQPQCVKNGVGILCYSPLCQGLLTGKFSSADEVPPARARTRLFSSRRPQARHTEPGCEEEVFQAIAEIRDLCADLGLSMGNVSLAWLLGREGVTSVVVGGRNARQVVDNAKAADVKLPGDTLDRLSRLSEAVKARIGGNADMWETASRMER